MTTETVAHPLADQIAAVIAARTRAAEATGLLSQARNQWELEHKAELDAARVAREDLQDAEENLRVAATRMWLASDRTTKTLAPGVGIREITRYAFHPDHAFAWAKEHGMCLQLDEKAFKKVADAGAVPATVVTIYTEPVATLATELRPAD